MAIRIGPLSLPLGRDTGRDDPYWDLFVNRPLAHPNNLIPNGLRNALEGGVSPTRGEVHSPNVMAGNVKEFGRFLGADLVGITQLANDPFRADDESTADPGPESGGGPYFAVLCAVRDEFDVRTAQGIGGQSPRLKGLFVTYVLAAYIRELGYRATRREMDARPLAVAAGLGTLTTDGRLVNPRFKHALYVAEVIYTELPLVADGRERAPQGEVGA